MGFYLNKVLVVLYQLIASCFMCVTAL